MTRIRVALLGAGSLAVFTAVLPSGAWAEPLSARDFTASCSGDAGARAMCDGYLRAVTDAAKIREDRGRNARVCVPDTLTIDQIRTSVLEFAARAPVGRDQGVQDQGAREQGVDRGNPVGTAKDAKRVESRVETSRAAPLGQHCA